MAGLWRPWGAGLGGADLGQGPSGGLGRHERGPGHQGTKLSFLCQQGLARSLNARYTTLHLHNMFDGMQTGMEGDDRDDDVGMDVGPGQRGAGAGGIG